MKMKLSQFMTNVTSSTSTVIF